MFAAAYWMARTANQRREDFAIVKSLSSRIFTAVKNYYHDLLNRAPANRLKSPAGWRRA
jgi:hypothetical protein